MSDRQIPCIIGLNETQARDELARNGLRVRSCVITGPAGSDLRVVRQRQADGEIEIVLAARICGNC